MLFKILKKEGENTLYGFEAISHYNGWAMALAGGLIVFSGLVVLATVISQLHKVILFFENGVFSLNNKKSSVPDRTTDTENEEAETLQNLDINQIISLYWPLADKLGESFELTQLYETSQSKGLPHPHLSIKELRQSAVLLPLGDGIFCWNQPIEN